MINRDKEEFLNKCREDQNFVKQIVDNFHKLYYYTSSLGMTWKNTYWMGIPIQKTPMDCFVYQEIIHSIKPDYIIETGTKVGGSALFFASICDIINHGEVITIDINKEDKLPTHNRIAYLTGNSLDENIIDFIKPRIVNKKVMVILDSDHSKEHVLRELEIYSKFVSEYSYLIVEDTNIYGFPVVGQFYEGPLEAIKEFLKTNKNFKVDRSCEKFFMTFSPCGFLIKVG